MLSARELSIEVSGRTILSGATFSVHHGEKVGLVGRNGAGKTTLLRTLATERPLLSGDVTVTGALGYLSQQPRLVQLGDHRTALTHVLSGRGLDEALERLEKLRLTVEEQPSDRNVRRFARAEEEFRGQDGYRAESDVRRICAGLGLAADRVDVQLAHLSGGERRRVELARILYGGSDNLLLDEPTNHLDVDTKQWLMDFLRSYRGALLVVSHDLQLLDQAITRVLHLDDGVLREYRGTYTQYLDARAKDEERLRRMAEREGAEIVRLSTMADKMRHSSAKRARAAKSLDKRVERLKETTVTPIAKQRSQRFRFPPPPHSGRLTLQVADLAKAYGTKQVWSDLTFTLDRGERLLALGLNGAGKTTLLRVLAEQEQPDRGSVVLGTGVSIGYYAQEHEGIRAGTSVLAHLRGGTAETETEQRALLGMFRLTGDVAAQDAGTLSGGEKTKLALAQLVNGRHNTLLLDEPTNNLDPQSRIAISTALKAWPGSMILVSHDVEFVRQLEPDRVLLLPEGDLDYWKEDLLELVPLA
ncbi:MAG TPA: ABC-F family ATP-binding cassette domain-containing protein [Acidimicrobiia bacterium]|nr:ABC-F family ATP-binding cassette domain-containing protein [Acidimicrobiia bacterium]